MKRHTITLNAPTSAGGKVLSASSSGSINGMTIALEDDVASCPLCNSQGKIVCIGPRIQKHGTAIIDKIKDGDIEAGLSQASKPRAALPAGRGQTGRHNQPCVTFEHFETTYKAAGGSVK